MLPINLYGPNENFDPERSHVLPSMMRKDHCCDLCAVAKILEVGLITWLLVHEKDSLDT